jgi:hypothetical protein
MLLEHANDLTEILRQRIARAEDIQLLLYEETSFISHRLFSVADVNDAPGESNQFDCRAERFRSAYYFDHDVGTGSVGQFRQNFRRILPASMNDVRGACLVGDS